jgi:hypothetical protein
VARTAQNADAEVIIQQLRKAMEKDAPEWTFKKGIESGPGRSGDFFLEWTHGDQSLDVSCYQYESAEEAVSSLHQLRHRISAGVPSPLSGVADEAYYLSPYGTDDFWRTYFARRWFVCHAGGGPKEATLRLTATLVKVLDAVALRASDVTH